MNCNRWLIIALVISWTLNVALGVALVMRSVGHRIGEEVEERLNGMPLPPLPPFPDRAMEQFRHKADPFHNEVHQLVQEMREIYCQDQLDTLRFRQIVDSLAQVRGNLQRSILMELAAIHPTLTSKQRLGVIGRAMMRMGHGRWALKRQAEIRRGCPVDSDQVTTE